MACSRGKVNRIGSTSSEIEQLTGIEFGTVVCDADVRIGTETVLIESAKQINLAPVATKGRTQP